MASGVLNTTSKRVTVNGIIDHATLINKNIPNQHPISAISGLQEELDILKSGTAQQVEDLNAVVEQARLDLQKTAVAIQKESATKVELNNAETSLKAELNEVEAEIKDTLKDTEAELKEDLREAQTSLENEITNLDNEFSEKLEFIKELSDNKYSTKAEFVTLSNTLSSALLKVDEDMTGLQRITADQMTDLQEATTEQLTTFKETSDLKFSELQEDLDNRLEEVGTKITTDIQPKLDTLATNISTIETTLSNTSNIYHTKNAEAPAVPLDEVIDELYQGSGNAKNITYTSGEDEKPLNEVIDELYQGSGSAANISYTEDKTVYQAISGLEGDLIKAVSAANGQLTAFKTETAENISSLQKEFDENIGVLNSEALALRELIDKFHPIQLSSLSIKAKGGSALPTTVEIGYMLPDLIVSITANKPINETCKLSVEKQAFDNIKLSSQGDIPSIVYTSTDISFANDNQIILSENKNYSISLEVNTSVDSQAAANWISKTYTIRATYPVFYGNSSSDIIELNGLTKKLSTTKAIGNVEVTVGNNEYFYFALPHSYGTPIFKVGGFEGGVSKIDTSLSYNCNNVDIEYDLYRSTNSNLGKTTFNIS
jgi:hypothetical protein